MTDRSPGRGLPRKMQSYSSTAILFWLAILFYRFNPYYEEALRSDTQATLLYLALAYTCAGAVYYALIPEHRVTPGAGLIIVRALARILKEARTYLTNFTSNPEHKTPALQKHEKTAILFTLVKLYFFPMMLNSFYILLHDVVRMYSAAARFWDLFSMEGYITAIHPLLIGIIFLIDTAYYSFGYAVEAGALDNRVRSVEPTVLGWCAALACYSPFKAMLCRYTNWYPDYLASVPDMSLTFIMRVAVVLLLLVYVWATVSLGAKCSNLTNRGIVDRGAYAVVRHPAYASKNIAWWITVLPVMDIYVFLGMLTWSFIYYLRAITEERHLIAEPEYREYCRRVRFRFIPFVW